MKEITGDDQRYETSNKNMDQLIDCDQDEAPNNGKKVTCSLTKGGTTNPPKK